MLKSFRMMWAVLRELSGDDAYERYLKRYAQHQALGCEHACQKPLTKKEFFKRWQDEKWHGIKRCC